MNTNSLMALSTPFPPLKHLLKPQNMNLMKLNVLLIFLKPEHPGKTLEAVV
jgi:hypothetical protein